MDATKRRQRTLESRVDGSTRRSVPLHSNSTVAPTKPPTPSSPTMRPTAAAATAAFASPVVAVPSRAAPLAARRRLRRARRFAVRSVASPPTVPKPAAPPSKVRWDRLVLTCSPSWPRPVVMYYLLHWCAWWWIELTGRIANLGGQWMRWSHAIHTALTASVRFCRSQIGG